MVGHQIANLVQELTTTGTTGSLTLQEVAGRKRFAGGTVPAFSTGGASVFPYFVSHRTAAEYEWGTGSCPTTNTLARDVVEGNSLGSTAKISFTAGTMDVTCAIPAEESGGRQRVDQLSTVAGTTILQNRISILASTAAATHTLESPQVGTETTIVLTVPTTQAMVTVAAATNVAIGPSGENALTFATSVSTFEYVKLVGTSTSQYHILFRTTGVSVAASS